MKKAVVEKLHPINKPSENGQASETSEKTTKDSNQNDKPHIISSILMSVVALLCATGAAALISTLFVDYTFEYINTVSAAKMDAHSAVSSELCIDESDAPVIPPEPIYYNFYQPIPDGPAVSYDYFDDTVFIGDSRTKGLLMFTELSPYNFSSVGLNVSSLQEKAFIRLKDENGEFEQYTLFEALEREKDHYKSIYIATGLNELGWSVDGFMDAFAKFVYDIREITNVPIYVQLVIPVTTLSSQTTKYGITNEKCVAFNARIRAFCAKQELFLLDPLSLFVLEDGTLDPAHSSDGVHLNRDSCKILADYYRTHVVNIYAYDNTRPPEYNAPNQQ